MSTLLFRLTNVPEDEADEIRALLQSNGIDYYETSAGNWGISMPALWLIKDEDLFKARQLLDEYQHQRLITEREKYLQLKKSGANISFISSIKERPLRFIVYLGAILLILYASFKMVFEFGLKF
ncbi:DUF6164 family protein [Methylobacter sp. YRD-M1]|uniref:DUF6164 family protein n=1 Tax=Methylobacter sp. YRD-M1 TaxID=2911520 RepID=UPI00227BB7CD|nr:DUF6164 family protein [Methylobacter sp. YRD-M1]WAK01456.1 DUF6164 family protein [Methylobacter sp. YRD-M1]